MVCTRCEMKIIHGDLTMQSSDGTICMRCVNVAITEPRTHTTKEWHEAKKETVIKKYEGEIQGYNLFGMKVGPAEKITIEMEVD